MLNLLTHAFRMVFGNLGAALRISVGPVLIIVAVTALFYVVADEPFGTTVTSETMENFPWGMFFLTFVVSAACLLWVATAWHRYILLEEHPGMLPAFNGARILDYLGRGVLLFAMLFVILFIIALVAGFVLATFLGDGNMTEEGGFFVGLVFALVVYIPMLFLYYRLCAVLPAAAVGKSLGFKQAFSATAPGSTMLLAMGIFWTVAGFVGAWVIEFVVVAVPIIGFVLWIVFNWVVAMVNLSIMSTIYGHYVEGRELNG